MCFHRRCHVHDPLPDIELWHVKGYTSYILQTVAVHFFKYNDIMIKSTFIPVTEPICYPEGQIVTLSCVVPAQIGVLAWDGVGFFCPNPSNPIVENVIRLLTTTSQQCYEEHGVCGPYSGTLSCLGNGSLISDLSFVTDSSMNGGNIVCAYQNQLVQTIPLLVGSKYIA